MVLHVNRQDDQNAPGYSTPVPKPVTTHKDTRDAVIGLWDLTELSKRIGRFHRIRDMASLVEYGLKIWSRKRKIPMNVPKMIEDWRSVIVILCTAHDKGEIDKAEYQMDELLSPLLIAPVAELRAFYDGLSSALESDPKVPFFIWSIFSAWGEVVVKPSLGKTKIKRLRRKLANDIAQMVDDDIKPDITKAVAGALMWRDPETLKEIKADLDAGAKPKLRGRESCLFLVTMREDGTEHQVML